MFVLDTDTLSLFLQGHARVSERVANPSQEVTLSLITRIEILQGRFASVLKAEDGDKLLQAQRRLYATEQDLSRFVILTLDPPAAAEFDKLRRGKKLKRIGRNDLLIAAITLANRGTLVTRNRQDFERVPGLSVQNWAD